MNGLLPCSIGEFREDGFIMGIYVEDGDARSVAQPESQRRLTPRIAERVWLSRLAQPDHVLICGFLSLPTGKVAIRLSA